MPATQVSDRRDLVVQLLGELYFVERRLADQVIGDLVDAVEDDELKQALRHHRKLSAKITLTLTGKDGRRSVKRTTVRLR